ncbi:MAG: protein kinase [Myxococcaceae bacterium]|nr:protein kinase [Myxococcaceae bacterium]
MAGLKPHPFTEAPTPPHGLRPARPDAPPLPWSGGLKPLDPLGNHQLLERLGRGNLAEVFVARSVIDGGVEKVVALALKLDDGSGVRFLEAARIAAAQQHKGLVQVFDCGEALGRPYLTMEYVRGRDLETLSRRARETDHPLWRPFVLRVLAEVARALEHLHAQGLTHREVSLDNVLVSEFGEVKLMGLSLDPHDPNPQADVAAVGSALRALLPTGAEADGPYGSARELAVALEQALAREPGVELGEIVRSLCSAALDDEKRRIAEATLRARAARPATRGPLNRLWRAAARTRPGQLLARRPDARKGLSVALAVLVAAAGVVAAKRLLDARALGRALEHLDERMNAGALNGPGDTAVSALAQARSVSARDPRVEARARELARVLELLAASAAQRGNHREAVVHLGALAAADPGRPGLIVKLVDAHRRAQ